MEVHAFTKYELARARDEERLLRAMDAYRALRSREPDIGHSVVESRAGRFRMLDRILRRELVATRAAAGQAG